MRLLLDTHVVLWWLGADRRLSDAVRERLGDRATEVSVSTVTVWEIAIKRSAGKLDSPDDLLDQLDRHGFDVLPFTGEDAWMAGHLPPIHADPFDRALVAQAVRGNMTLVTADRRVLEYGVPVIQP